jgi:hypothetical protein
MPPTSPDISAAEARQTLDAIEHRRQQVIAEIDVPGWYWWFLAFGWVAVGAVVQFGGPVAVALAPLLFGAVHAALAQRALTGRHRTGRLSVRADVAGRYVPLVLVAFVLVLCAATLVLALIADADGARHPGLLASSVVALVLLCGGPQLMAALRRRRARAGAA